MDINSELRPLEAHELDAVSGAACKVNDAKPITRVDIPVRGCWPSAPRRAVASMSRMQSGFRPNDLCQRLRPLNSIKPGVEEDAGFDRLRLIERQWSAWLIAAGLTESI